MSKQPATADTPPPAPRRPGRGARAVADLVDEALRPAARRRGFATTDLIRDWAAIVGPVHALSTRPDRLSWPRRLEDGGEDGFEPATLFVTCEGARALLFQHEIPVILERINAVFGYPAVGRIRLAQKPVTRPRLARPPRPAALSAAEEARVAALTAEIENEGLRRALVDLGRAVLGTRGRA